MNFFELYTEACSTMESSESFDRWGGLSCVAAALGSKCYLGGGSMMGRLNPNMYVMFVARTALCRKSTAVGAAVNLCVEAFDPATVAQSIRKEAIYSLLSDVFRETKRGELFLNSDEFSVFLGPEVKKTGIIEALTTLYDRNNFEYRTLARGREFSDNIAVNILCASTAKNLKLCIPPEAVGGGFLSRMVLVYGAAPKLRQALPEITEREVQLRVEMIKVLQSINKLEGPFTFSAGAADAYKKLYNSMADEVHSDRDLEAYLARRPVILKKLSMILAAGRRLSRTINEEDILDSASLIKEVDKWTPIVSRLLGTTTLGEAAKEVLLYVSTKRKVTRSALTRKFLHKEARNATLLDKVIKILKDGAYISEDIDKRAKIYRALEEVDTLKDEGALD